MSSNRVKAGMINSLILLVIAVYLFLNTPYQIVAIILLGCMLISTDVAGTLYDEQKRLKILRM